jgi:diguanylate cyclase (GGDEF)-like protein
MIKRFFNSSSIRHKVVVQVTSQVVLALVLIILLMVFFINAQLNRQIEAQLEFQANALNDKIEQRLQYLVENTRLLTSNDLMINALTDTKGRQAYLPALVKNFSEGKDVVSLNIVDYDGRPIFQTQQDIPRYNDSPQLRAALALGQLTIYISDRNHQLTVVSPIQYYSTTQGAVIVEFNLDEIIKRNLPQNEALYVKLIKGGLVLLSYNHDPEEFYKSSLHRAQGMPPLFQRLGIEMQTGVPDKIYKAPVIAAIKTLLMIGLVITLISVILATRTAKHITAPILELYRRVKASTAENEVLCSPLGTSDELEDLAKAFDERTLMLQYQAEHDSLTNLPNRLLFLDRLRQSIKKAERDKTKLAVLFIDLDRFKEVNDSFGHAIGDELLQVVAKIAKQVLRKSDSIARLGGDEFSVMLEDIHNDELIIDVTQKLLAVFKEPFVLEHNEFFITCSVGIAVYPFNGNTPEELLKNADAAMYRAKDEGRNTYQYYTQDMTEKAFERVTLETQLRQAIINNEFEVYFQPQYIIESGYIFGMEALIRWKHPKMGMVSPARFIPLAEETGMIVEIDRLVMKMAMVQFNRWKQQGLKPGNLSINLSMIQINHEDFLDAVKVNIFDAHIDTSELFFEVTETQVMRNPERSIIMLQRLKDLGVSLAIDDFGTGHSSLSYLKRLPVDKIKIDQSFIMDIPHDKDDIELTNAIIALSKSLNLQIIAEGVETKEQADFLFEAKCSEAQGYYFSKPVDAQNMEILLQKNIEIKKAQESLKII